MAIIIRGCEGAIIWRLVKHILATFDEIIFFMYDPSRKRDKCRVATIYYHWHCPICNWDYNTYYLRCPQCTKDFDHEKDVRRHSQEFLDKYSMIRKQIECQKSPIEIIEQEISEWKEIFKNESDRVRTAKQQLNELEQKRQKLLANPSS